MNSSNQNMYRFSGLDNEQRELGKVEASSAQEAQELLKQQHPTFQAIGIVEQQVSGNWKPVQDYPH